MAHVIIMPKLGLTQEEGQLVKWHKKIGDFVKKGEVFFETNTDKMVMAIEAAHDGYLLKTMLGEGEFAPVLTPIAVLGEAGEDPDKILMDFAGALPSPPKPDAASAAVATPEKGRAAEASVEGSLRKLSLSPTAKKYIKDEGINASDLDGIEGTGFQGCVVPEDIKSFLASRIRSAEPSGSQEAGQQIRSISPYKGIRKTIGTRLSKSKLEAPHVYFTESVDTSSLAKFRHELNERNGEKIAFSDLLVLATGKALDKYPDLNVSLRDDEIICYKSINIGIAVAGEGGLIVPVVKDVQVKDLTAIARESRALVQKAKEGRLSAEEYSGGTFTISNLGMFGIENFSAIINPPESAILSISSIRKKIVVVADEKGEDAIAIRPMMNMTLSVDHRLIDGFLAVQFLGYLKQLLEFPNRISG